ncbi:hypothetical protein DL96DRAFT_1498557 [Flagelloscypha sp. PMI_526]|nr:hypothetical protein DL96DRAFT_1498557 [Flagelloscypha sp. PMI_526]
MSGRAISAVGWSVEELTKKHGFQSVRRISWKDVTPRDIISYEEGTPLIISDYQDHASWNPNFNITHFKDALEEPRTLTVRNVFSSEDSIMAVDNFLSQSATHPEQQGESKPFYAKDAPCPDDWAKWLESSRVLPAEVIPHAHNDMQRNLPRKYSPETLMTYLGYGDTYTPFHKDPCASSGQNLMVYTENGGSSFWFMTESTPSPDVSSFFKGELGSDLDWENYAALPEELEKAPFTIYVCEQVIGDLVLVPPRSAHQVINNAGLTVKMSWSRMTLRGLEIAIYHELPIYRRVLRPETYRTKWTLYYTIRQLAANLKGRRLDPAATLFAEDASRFEKALRLFDYVLETEGPPVDTKMYGRKLDHLRIICTGSLAPASDLSCDFCSADIFNAFFECRSCRHGNNSIVICPGCYSEGNCLSLPPLSPYLSDHN